MNNTQALATGGHEPSQIQRELELGDWVEVRVVPGQVFRAQVARAPWRDARTGEWWIRLHGDVHPTPLERVLPDTSELAIAEGVPFDDD